MKLIKAEASLGLSGLPQLCIEVEPETSLERDVLRAMEYKRVENWMDKTKDILVGTTQPNEKSDRMLVWLDYQISQENYLKRRT